MILGLGTDIVKIMRLQRWQRNQNLLLRYFAKAEIDLLSEIEHKALETLAGFFAAKEAFIKAVRKKVILKDIVIEKEIQGAPRLRLERSAQKALVSCAATTTWVSIAHEKEFAIATVVIC